MALLRRASGGSAGRPFALGECPLVLQGAADLWAFLAEAVWAGTEEARELGTVLLFVEQGHVKALLNDKAQKIVAFTTLDPGEDLLTQLDMLVTEPSVDWRPSKFQVRGK